MSDMTDQRPEELRREIARTRADMDRTLAELEDRVSPSRIRERQTERIRSRWQRTREAVMGSSGDGAMSRMSDRAGELSQSMQDAPERLEDTTRGNPLAAGMVAFGLGAVAGSLFPSSAPERSMASGLREEFEEPVRSELQQAGEQMKGDLQEHAERAMEDTKHAAQEGMQRTQEQAQGSAEEVREHAQDSAQHVRGSS